MMTDWTVVLSVIVIPVTNTIREIDMIVTAAMTGESIDLAATADTVATGKLTFNCILMAGISLILSLVVGNVWIKGSETYQSRINDPQGRRAYAHEFIVMPVLAYRKARKIAKTKSKACA